MPGRLEVAVTILDLPEVMELIEECLQAVPAWEQALLRERLALIMQRAKKQRDLHSPG